MKNYFISAMVLSIIALSSCTKEEELDLPVETFQPTGFWRGKMYFSNCAILNRADGSSLLYFEIAGTDTTSQMAGKFPGKFEIRNNRLFASYKLSSSDSIHMFSSKTESGYMKGVFTLPSSAQAADFEFFRQ